MRTRLVLALAVVLAVGVLGPRSAPAQNDESVAPRITVDELKKLRAEGQVVIVDVRGEDSYKAGHIPGAISVPLERVKAHAPKLAAARKTIVTYCA